MSDTEEKGFESDSSAESSSGSSAEEESPAQLSKQLGKVSAAIEMASMRVLSDSLLLEGELAVVRETSEKLQTLSDKVVTDADAKALRKELKGVLKDAKQRRKALKKDQKKKQKEARRAEKQKRKDARDAYEKTVSASIPTADPSAAADVSSSASSGSLVQILINGADLLWCDAVARDLYKAKNRDECVQRIIKLAEVFVTKNEALLVGSPRVTVFVKGEAIAGLKSDFVELRFSATSDASAVGSRSIAQLLIAETSEDAVGKLVVTGNRKVSMEIAAKSALIMKPRVFYDGYIRSHLPESEQKMLKKKKKAQKKAHKKAAKKAKKAKKKAAEADDEEKSSDIEDTSDGSKKKKKKKKAKRKKKADDSDSSESESDCVCGSRRKKGKKKKATRSDECESSSNETD